MPHDLACRCGAIRELVERDARANHMVCYCADCQDYAHVLGRPDILDERGGTEVVQTMPKFVTLTHGADRLACLRMTGKGPLRWYASCCNTPIGNTALTRKIAFVGVVAACLTGQPVEETYGPVAMWGSTAGAKASPSHPRRPCARSWRALCPVRSWRGSTVATGRHPSSTLEPAGLSPSRAWLRQKSAPVWRGLPGSNVAASRGTVFQLVSSNDRWRRPPSPPDTAAGLRRTPAHALVSASSGRRPRPTHPRRAPGRPSSPDPAQLC
jgi:hypothetical protein